MGKVILETEIKREKGLLYYCGTNEKGNLTVCSAVMGRGRKAKNEAD